MTLLLPSSASLKFSWVPPLPFGGTVICAYRLEFVASYPLAPKLLKVPEVVPTLRSTTSLTVSRVNWPMEDELHTPRLIVGAVNASIRAAIFATGHLPSGARRRPRFVSGQRL
jgi:hypothetical protein